MISVSCNLLRLVLCPSIWSILMNVPCALENVHSLIWGWKGRRCQLSLSGLLCHLRLIDPCWSSEVSFYCIFCLSFEAYNSESRSHHHSQFQDSFHHRSNTSCSFSSHPPLSSPFSPRQPQIYRFVFSGHFMEMELYNVLSFVTGFFGLECFQSLSL